MTKRELQHLIEPDRFTRPWWLARTRGLIWVAVVTMFLWIWADIEFTDEMELSATVQLTTAPSSDLVLRSNSRYKVSFKVQGRQRSIEQLQQRLALPDAVIRHVVTKGEDNVSMRDILNSDEVMLREGLTVVSASPNYVQVRLDTRILVPDIPIKLDYEGALKPEIRIEPAKMGLHVARSDWQDILAREPSPELLTKKVDLKTIADLSKPFQVDIVPRIAGLPVEPNQPTVQVSVKVTLLTDTVEVTVPVMVLQPPGWLEDTTWKDYTLSRKDATEWRVTLVVSGPKADLDRLKPENARAYITLTDEDRRPVSWLTRQVEVQLPEDLNLTLVRTYTTTKGPVLGTPASVTFKLEGGATPVGVANFSNR